MNSKIFAEVQTAYADCWMENDEQGYRTRNLNFFASEPVNKEDAIAILSACIKGGYNNFESDLLNLFDDKCLFNIAREGSVCIYVDLLGSEMPSLDKLLADEVDEQEDGTFRVWWD